MGRACTICSHPERAAIEAAIVAGTVNREIACKYAVGRMAIERHAAAHIAQEIRHAQEAREEAQGLDVVRQLKDINEITLAILKEARSDQIRGPSLALQAIDRVHKQLELQAKLLGAIDTTQVNIWIVPEWLAIRSTLIQTLLPYPDARIAVAQALAGMEAHHARLN